MIIVGDRVYISRLCERGVVRAIMCDVLMNDSPTVIVDLDRGYSVVVTLHECFYLHGYDDVELAQ